MRSSLRSYLTDEDVGGGAQRLRRRGVHRPLHQPRDLPDDDLHDAEVVQDGDGAAEVDDGRQHLSKKKDGRMEENNIDDQWNSQFTNAWLA